MTPDTVPPSPQAAPPEAGFFTFVFTDIEGSSVLTRRFEAAQGQGEYEKQLRDKQRAVLLPLVEQNHGWEASRAGDGHFFVFVRPQDAFNAVIAFQAALSSSPIAAALNDNDETLVVRAGIHTCQAYRKAEKTLSNGYPMYEFPGSDTNFAARVGALGAGGQVLVSEAFVKAIWGDPLLNSFGHIMVNDQPVPYENYPKLELRCWPSRKLKSFDEDATHVFEILYDDETITNKREPGSRFFPDFYIGEVNRYVEREKEQNAVYKALGFDKSAKKTSPDRPATKEKGEIAIIYAEGGMGKTRLAVTCAVRAAGEFPDGVYFVPLSRNTQEGETGRGGAEFLVEKIIGAIPLHRQKKWNLDRPEGQLPTLPEVVAALKSRRLLLVVDNFESLAFETAAEFLNSLREARLHLLLTTRADPSVLGLGNVVELHDGMDEASAHALALARLHQKKVAETDWQPNPAQAISIREIIHLTGFPLAAPLPGHEPVYGAIPLALELALGNFPRLPLEEIADELRQTPLGFVSASFANWDDAIAYKRHHSVMHTLDWSFHLLEPDARRMFAASGLFGGSFSGEALMAVAGANKSLLAVLNGNALFRQTPHGDKTRYTLHNLSRAYARVCLLGGVVVTHYDPGKGEVAETRDARPDAQEICQRFVDWYSDFVIARLDGNNDLAMNTPEQRAPFETERDNFLAASEILCDTEAKILPPASARCRLGAFGEYLGRTGAWAEEESWYTRFADFTKDTKEEREYAWALHQLSNVYDKLGRYQDAINAYEKSGDILRKINDPQGEAASLHGLANVYDKLGRYQDAINAYEASLVIKRKINDPQGEAASLHGLANVYNKLGRYQDAINAYEKSGDIYRKINDPQGEAASLHGLANVYDKLGRYQDAINAYEKSGDIYRKINDPQGEAASLHGLANVYDKLGRYQDAINAYEASLVIKRKINDPQGEAASLHGLANVYNKLGRYQDAINAYEKSGDIYRKINDPQGEAASLHGLANVYNKLGRYQDAINAYEKSGDILRKINDPQGEAASLHGLANVYDKLGRYQDAINAYEKSGDIYRKINDPQGEAASLHGLANVYDKLGRYQDAINAYEKSGDIYRKINDPQGEAASLHGLANVYNKLGRYQDAINAYEKSGDILRKINDPQGEAASLHGLANVYDKLGRYQEAINAYEASLVIKRKINDPQGEAVTLAALGGVFFKQGNIKEATRHIRDGADRLLALGDFATAGIALCNLAVFQANAGQRQEAIASAREAVAAYAQTQHEQGQQKAAQLLANLQSAPRP